MGEQVGVQAYLLWEKAGRPDGADFSNDARQALERQLAGGVSLQDLEQGLRSAAPAPPQEALPQVAPLHAPIPADLSPLPVSLGSYTLFGGIAQHESKSALIALKSWC